MDVRDETHIIDSCYAASWEKHKCHLPGSEEHLLIYQGRQFVMTSISLSPGKLQAHCKMFLKVLR